MHTTTRPLTDLHPHPRNPRNGDTELIARSLNTLGQYRAIVTTTDGTILAGNHTYAAAAELGWAEMECHVLDVDPNSQQAIQIMLADNRTADVGNYDDGLLLALINDLDADRLPAVGYDEHDLQRLLASVNDTDPLGDLDDDDREKDTGGLLAIVDVAVGEPTHQPEHGTVWQVGRHTLVVARLRDEHHLWVPLLTDGVMFAPYPEPYFTTTDTARTNTLLLVQPNRYLAGHLLDKHTSAFPDDLVDQVGG